MADRAAFRPDPLGALALELGSIISLPLPNVKQGLYAYHAKQGGKKPNNRTLQQQRQERGCSRYNMYGLMETSLSTAA